MLVDVERCVDRLLLLEDRVGPAGRVGGDLDEDLDLAEPQAFSAAGHVEHLTHRLVGEAARFGELDLLVGSTVAGKYHIDRLIGRGGMGAVFLANQGWEYAEAPFSISSHAYGSIFYLATGFHGFHVLVGTIFLIVCLVRAYKGEFTPKQHFGFEAAAWYWHFVDVVWLFLFICVYVWGGWGAEVH